MSRIGFIGTGAIATPMVRSLAARGHEITVTRRSDAVASALAAEFGVAVAEARDALATEGTLRLQTVEALRHGGAGEVLCGALDAIETRLNG
ncbi:NAD(P)-binding domain-containing protein [Tropicimonas sp. IMCC6043]|uniref:NAD(P)-binding domain-containing protein n=1 Tax=Tropicimonas sp. IMCC6043 TaxID=2510645 RepID=UPI00101D99E6|nr:NAD(P)-binding domain-containing protein [Tropicimonas sp. IMCC6043]RYH08558.1 hypothetical protein EU800_16070 [Tropicimonas sp. IMCC6043]